MTMDKSIIEQLIFWCGIGHFALCAGSLLVPRVLQWQNHLKNLQPLLRQMFWTYAGYILATNFSFGLISTYANSELINGSLLAKGLTLFIGIYWLVRIAMQFLYFDKTDAPNGLVYTMGEIALVFSFALFTFTYLTAFLFNCEWI
jgi:hypothetical protein